MICILNNKCVLLASYWSGTFPDAEGHGDHSVRAGHSIQAADKVRQVVQHTQVMLHHNDVPVGHQKEIHLFPRYTSQYS